MMRLSRRSLSRSAVASYLCICVALAVLTALSIWSAYYDLVALREAMLRAELARLESHAQRTIGRLERDLESSGSQNLSDLNQSKWLPGHWREFIHTNQGIYAAVIDNDGNIVLHTSPAKVGRRLPSGWSEGTVRELGSNVVFTHNETVATAQGAYDVPLPITINGVPSGTYHVGVPLAVMEAQVAARERALFQRRALMIGGVLTIVLLATTSLYYIANHAITMRRNLTNTSLERATEVGALAAGLAHEIRNPLHAVQLNLHTLNRACQRGQVISSQEMNQILDESTQEIQRIEQLMQQLVGFATPEQPRDERIDIVEEVSRVVEFIDQEMLAADIELSFQGPDQPIWVRMDHGRLRQVMLNLLQNAQQAMPSGGRLSVSIKRHRNQVQVLVQDNGAGIPAKDRERIFEPFYSTKGEGTGLGLALVKRFVQEADGTIEVEDNTKANEGSTFCVQLPMAKRQHAS